MLHSYAYCVTLSQTIVKGRISVATTLPILVSVVSQSDQGVKGAWFTAADALAIVDVPIDVLQSNLAALSSTILSLLSGIAPIENFRLKEVRVQIEISAEGGVTLIGSAKVGERERFRSHLGDRVARTFRTTYWHIGLQQALQAA